jgi:predicted nucleic acid-binding protein
MRTNVVIDEKLMGQALKAGGFETKRSTAEKSAANYRRLREKGVTIRKTIDVLIGTFCVEHDIALLHQDRDFEAMKKVMRLKTF